MKIVMCGSMVFSKQMLRLKNQLTRLGHKVILPKFTENYAKLDCSEKMHNESAKNKIKYGLIRNYFDKIKNFHAILVVNEKKADIDNYIGGNAFLEMGFTHILGKKIYLLNPIPDQHYKDEILDMEPEVIDGDLGRLNKFIAS